MAETFNVVMMEIPARLKNKYEVDHETGRVLWTAPCSLHGLPG